MTADLSDGQAFGPYHIAGTAGAGGMGVVYRAEQRSLARVVALKVIRPDISQSADYRNRFLREARLAAAVDHPHVVSVFDVGEQAGRLYLTMQWVDGQNLRNLLDQQRRLAPDRTALIGTQLAGALQAVHEAGLVHRDVKPSNVLMRDIGGRDHAYLTDFGIAKMPGVQDDLTRTGWSVGTPGYLSPEQIRGERPGPYSDLYALGCVLFEALTGRRPFGGENDLVMQWAHLNNPRPAVSVVGPDLGPRYDEFFARALAVNPGERFPSGRAFAEALQAAHAGRYGAPLAMPAEEARGQATVQADRAPTATSRPQQAASGPPSARPAPGELDPTRTRAWPGTPPEGEVRPGPARPDQAQPVGEVWPGAARSDQAQQAARGQAGAALGAGQSGPAQPAGQRRPGAAPLPGRPGPGQQAGTHRAGASGARGRVGRSPVAGTGRVLVLAGALLFLAAVTVLTDYTNNGTGWKSLWQATHHDPASPLVAANFWILIVLVALAVVFTLISLGGRLAVIVAVLASLAAVGYTIYLPMKGTSPGFQPYGSSFWLSLAAAGVMALGAGLALGGRRA
ncbi:MAG TPA: protein kinase [Streptosporangiaceae bacterium]|nr:protein kinase [Streptosporangiaceae bacterium]